MVVGTSNTDISPLYTRAVDEVGATDAPLPPFQVIFARPLNKVPFGPFTVSLMAVKDCAVTRPLKKARHKTELIINWREFTMSPHFGLTRFIGAFSVNHSDVSIQRLAQIAKASI